MLISTYNKGSKVMHLCYYFPSDRTLELETCEDQV